MKFHLNSTAKLMYLVINKFISLYLHKGAVGSTWGLINTGPEILLKETIISTIFAIYSMAWQNLKVENQFDYKQYTNVAK